eukprot:UN14275
MKKIQLVKNKEIQQYKKEGAVLLKNKFSKDWIEKLKIGIEKSKKDNNSPCYLEDFWTWNLQSEFKDFVFNSPVSNIAAELLDAKKINLVMDR